MIYGYARVSTPHQRLDMQLNALNRFGIDALFSEKISARKKRPALEEMLQTIVSGDTVVVYQLTRLGRSIKQLIDIMQSLQEREIQFVSLQDSIDTSTPNGRFFVHVLCALSELELSILSDRTKQGMAAARNRGKQIGRPKGATVQTKRKLKKCIQLIEEQSFSINDACLAVGISKPTFYKWR